MAKNEKVDAQDCDSVAAWRIAATKPSRYFIALDDPEFLFDSVQPGDALALLDESGDLIWGVRRVFLVRRETSCVRELYT